MYCLWQGNPGFNLPLTNGMAGAAQRKNVVEALLGEVPCIKGKC